MSLEDHTDALLRARIVYCLPLLTHDELVREATALECVTAQRSAVMDTTYPGQQPKDGTP